MGLAGLSNDALIAFVAFVERYVVLCEQQVRQVGRTMHGDVNGIPGHYPERLRDLVLELESPAELVERLEALLPDPIK